MWLWWKFCCCHATLCKMCDCENKTQHNWGSAAPCDTWRWSVNCDWHAQMRLGIVPHCCSCILEICIYGCILRFHSQVNRLGTLYNINSSFLSYHLWNKFCLRLCTCFPFFFFWWWDYKTALQVELWGLLFLSRSFKAFTVQVTFFSLTLFHNVYIYI